ncbi:MAG: hypothetical protein AB7R55_05025 [Gemmatimonadales bacterium]
MPAHGAGPLEAVRRALRAVLGLGLIGTGAELLLLGHSDDLAQWVPLVIVPLALLALLWRVASDGTGARVGFRWAMMAAVASGVVGLWLHYRGNAQFELEMDPDLGGWTLFAEAMTGATPALAPGAMTLLGLIGLVSEIGGNAGRSGAKAGGN